MKIHTKTLLAALAMIGTASAASAATVALDIVNPSFEDLDGNTAPYFGAAGWTFNADNAWATVDGSGQQTDDPNSAQDGTYFIYGGWVGVTGSGTSGGAPTPNPDPSIASQSIDISTYATDIDAGGVTVDLDYFYNDREGSGGVEVTIEFFDASNGSLGSVSSGLSATNGIAAWSADGIADGAVPVNTRSLEIQILGTRNGDGTNTNTSVDNFSGSLNGVVPEPSSLALLGLGGLCVLRRRRG